ncbi:MAG: TldD/PmbA family protein [Oligoflexus sp.]
MSKTADLLELALTTVKMGKKYGASEVLSRTQSQRSVSFQVRDGDLEKVEDSTSQTLAIDLYVDHRYSTHRTSDLRPASLEAFIKNAVETTKFLEKDQDRRLTDAELQQSISRIELDLTDQRVLQLNRDQRLQACQRMDERLKGKKYLISASSGQGDSYAQMAMASSDGLAFSHEMTNASLYSSVSLDGRDGRKPSAGFGMAAVHLGQLYAAEKIADEALSQAYLAREMGKGPNAKTTMVVDRMASARLISQLLRPAIAQAVYQKRSCFMNRIGQSIVSEKLSLQDQPLLPRALRSRLFDTAGLASHPMWLIQEGKLENIYVDPYYGRKLKMRPTAVGPSNVLVKPGSHSQAEILAIADKGIMVTDWIGGNMDAGTGDFSFGVQGFMIEKGKLGRPVSEMNMTGNLLELFARLVEVGNDTWRYSYSGIQAPTLAFENVQFSGASQS